jgi:hypothetical protein
VVPLAGLRCCEDAAHGSGSDGHASAPGSPTSGAARRRHFDVQVFLSVVERGRSDGSSFF